MNRFWSETTHIIQHKHARLTEGRSYIHLLHNQLCNQPDYMGFIDLKNNQTLAKLNNYDNLKFESSDRQAGCYATTCNKLNA